MKDVFDDLIKGFFGAVDNLPINIDLFDTQTAAFNEIFDQQFTLNEVKENDDLFKPLT